MYPAVRFWGLSLAIGASLGIGLLGTVPATMADETDASQAATTLDDKTDETEASLFSTTIDTDDGEATVTIEMLDGKITGIDIDSPNGVLLSDLTPALEDCAAQGSTEGGASDATDSASNQEASDSTGGTKQVLGIADVDWLVNQQPLHVINTQYLVQSDQYKALYPDLMSATIENSGTDDIKDAVVAFVAWDANGLPVKIEGQFDFSGGRYVALVNFDAINMVPGTTFGESSGLPLDQDCDNIATFKATVVSYTRFDGSTWENPYFGLWKMMYEGVKYTDDMTIEAVVEQ